MIHRKVDVLSKPKHEHGLEIKMRKHTNTNVLFFSKCLMAVLLGISVITTSDIHAAALPRGLSVTKPNGYTNIGTSTVTGKATDNGLTVTRPNLGTLVGWSKLDIQ
jgi:hypothetical protein